MDAFDFAAAHRQEFLDELKDLIRIPSISTSPDHAHDMKRAADWLMGNLKQIGLKNVAIHPTAGHPIVYAEWLGAPGTPTVLIYGHYDVQPAEPLELWDSPPFEPTERNGSLYARGATDDKGQAFIHVKAIESLMQQYGGKLPVNVKLFIEGEEEIGSKNLEQWIETHQDMLRADVLVISDSHMLALDRPTIVYALRGLIYFEIEVKGPATDLHSGSYGGAVHNPLQALCEIVAALHDSDGSIAVPGFYDKVRSLSDKERTEIAAAPWTDEEWKHETGAPQTWGEAAYTLRERVGARPTLEVHGLIGGYTTPGGQKTVLPAKAMAKISCRLVADQDPHEIEALVAKYVASLTPPTVTSEFRSLESYNYPSIVPIDSPAMDAAIAAYERGFGKKPIFMREGGSIPVVATIQRMFGMPVLLLGFGLPDDNLHAPNEKFNLEGFYRGIDTAIALLENLAKQKK